MIDCSQLSETELIATAAKCLEEWHARKMAPHWKCEECKEFQSAKNFRYEAHHKETQKVIRPLCALCIRGDKTERFIDGTWKHIGPLKA